MAQTIWTFENTVIKQQIITGQFHFSTIFFFSFILFHSHSHSRKIRLSNCVWYFWHDTIDLLNEKSFFFLLSENKNEDEIFRRNLQNSNWNEFIKKNLVSKINYYSISFSIHFVSYRFSLYGPGPGCRHLLNREWTREAKKRIVCVCLCVRICFSRVSDRLYRFYFSIFAILMCFNVFCHIF